MPGGPRKQTLARSSIQASWARCKTRGGSAEACALQSKSSSVFSADLIAAEGEPGETTYVIVDGEVNVVGGDRTLAVRSAGNVIGEMAVIQPPSRRVATGKVRCPGARDP